MLLPDWIGACTPSLAADQLHSSHSAAACGSTACHAPILIVINLQGLDSSTQSCQWLADQPSEKYFKSAKLAKAMQRDTHYTIDEKQKAVLITDDGYEAAEDVLQASPVKAVGLAGMP